MHCNDEGNAVILLRENPGPVGIPGMTMHNLSIDAGGVKIDAALHCAQSRAELFRTIPAGHVQLKPAHYQITGLDLLIAEAADFYGHQLAQFARQISPRPSGPAVSARRI